MAALPISDAARALVGSYPTAGALRAVLGLMDLSERNGFIRLWLTEGIPFAFRDVPMLYEALRQGVATRLGTHPKEVVLIGSGRIGYSLSGALEYGREFRAGSDLDINVVSGEVFRGVSEDFERWRTEWQAGNVSRPEGRRGRYWLENLDRLPKNLAKGFVDAYKIPAWPRYPIAERIVVAEHRLGQKLKSTLGAPIVRGLSIRVYRDWEALLRQSRINLDALRTELERDDARAKASERFAEDGP